MATVRRPSSLAARKMRMAISLRFAARMERISGIGSLDGGNTRSVAGPASLYSFRGECCEQVSFSRAGAKRQEQEEGIKKPQSPAQMRRADLSYKECGSLVAARFGDGGLGRWGVVHGEAEAADAVERM